MLKLFYVITIIAFFVINAHAFALFARLLQPLANISYKVEPGPSKDIFVAMIVYTMIVSVSDIFLLKQLGKETMRWFFIMMIADNLCILLNTFITIIVYNIKDKSVGSLFDLLNGGLLIALYTLKRVLFLFLYRKKIIAEN